MPKESIRIQTPTATIGIRGTDFTTTVDELGRSLVILLPDERTGQSSGEITVSNAGGVVVLNEAYQATMVSTMETVATPPVTLNIDLNLIDNMFIVTPPPAIKIAQAEQAETKTETKKESTDDPWVEDEDGNFFFNFYFRFYPIISFLFDWFLVFFFFT